MIVPQLKNVQMDSYGLCLVSHDFHKILNSIVSKYQPLPHLGYVSFFCKLFFFCFIILQYWTTERLRLLQICKTLTQQLNSMFQKEKLYNPFKSSLRKLLKENLSKLDPTWRMVVTSHHTFTSMLAFKDVSWPERKGLKRCVNLR